MTDRRGLASRIDALLNRRDALEASVYETEAELTNLCKARDALIKLEDCRCHEQCEDCNKAERLLNNLLF